MLWLNGQLTPLATMRDLLLPSLVSLLVPVALLQLYAPEFKQGAASGGDSSGKSLGPGLSQQQQLQQQPVRPDLSLALLSSSPAASLSSRDAGGGSSSDAAASGSMDAAGGVSVTEVLAFEEASQRGPLVLAVGVAALLSVPVFKHLTGEGVRASCICHSFLAAWRLLACMTCPELMRHTDGHTLATRT